VSQFFPAVVCSFAKRNPVTPQGAFCGILIGTLAVVALTPGNMSLADVNVGLAALIVNIGITAIVSAATRRGLVPQQA
jgi:SSS family solute:Na+ symporter